MQLPDAGMLASLSETDPAVNEVVMSAPVQVVLPGCVAEIVSPLGNGAVKFACVRSNAFGLVSVIVSVETVFSVTLAGENAASTVGTTGTTASAVGQAVALVPPADASAVLLVAALALSRTVSTSMLPALSVIVRVSVPPLPGLIMTSGPLLAPEIRLVGDAVQA